MSKADDRSTINALVTDTTQITKVASKTKRQGSRTDQEKAQRLRVRNASKGQDANSVLDPKRYKGLDVNKTLPEFQLARLTHSYSRIERRLGKAIYKGNNDKKEVLMNLLLDKRFRILELQDKIKERGLTIDLTNSPKSVRPSPSSSYAGSVVSRGGHRVFKPVSKHGKPETYSEVIGSKSKVLEKPKAEAGHIEVSDITKSVPVPLFDGKKQPQSMEKHQLLVKALGVNYDPHLTKLSLKAVRQMYLDSLK